MQNTPAFILHNYVLQHKSKSKIDTLFISSVYLTSFAQTAGQEEGASTDDVFSIRQFTHQISK